MRGFVLLAAFMVSLVASAETWVKGYARNNTRLYRLEGGKPTVIQEVPAGEPLRLYSPATGTWYATVVPASNPPQTAWIPARDVTEGEAPTSALPPPPPPPAAGPTPDPALPPPPPPPPAQAEPAAAPAPAAEPAPEQPPAAEPAPASKPSEEAKSRGSVMLTYDAEYPAPALLQDSVGLKTHRILAHNIALEGAFLVHPMIPISLRTDFLLLGGGLTDSVGTSTYAMRLLFASLNGGFYFLRKPKLRAGALVGFGTQVFSSMSLVSPSTEVSGSVDGRIWQLAFRAQVEILLTPKIGIPLELGYRMFLDSSNTSGPMLNTPFLGLGLMFCF